MCEIGTSDCHLCHLYNLFYYNGRMRVNRSKVWHYYCELFQTMNVYIILKKVHKRPSYILLLSLSQIEKFYDIVIDELLSKEKM